MDGKIHITTEIVLSSLLEKEKAMNCAVHLAKLF